SSDLVGSALVASGDGEDRAGDVRGLRGREEADRRGLLVERPVAAEDGGVDGLVHDLLVPVLLLLGPGVAPAGDPTFRGERPARGGGHDPDAVRGRLERECGGQPVHAALGRGIRHPVDPAGRHRGDVDDRAGAPRDHRRQGRPAHPQRGEQGAAHLLLDLFLGVLLERSCPDGAADVVDQDVDPSVGGERGVSRTGGTREGLQVGDDGGDRVPARRCRGQLVGHCVDHLGAVDGGDQPALADDPVRDREADALDRTGDDDRQSVEPAAGQDGRDRVVVADGGAHDATSMVSPARAASAARIVALACSVCRRIRYRAALRSAFSKAATISRCSGTISSDTQRASGRTLFITRVTSSMRYAWSSASLPVQRKRNSWNCALVAVKRSGSTKRSPSMNRLADSASIRNSASRAPSRRPMVSSTAPSSSAMRASNWASDWPMPGCTSPLTTPVVEVMVSVRSPADSETEVDVVPSAEVDVTGRRVTGRGGQPTGRAPMATAGASVHESCDRVGGTWPGTRGSSPTGRAAIAGAEVVWGVAAGASNRPGVRGSKPTGRAAIAAAVAASRSSSGSGAVAAGSGTAGPAGAGAVAAG